MNDFESAVLVFGMRSHLLEHELDLVEQEYAIDLRRGCQRVVDTDASYYPQIESEIRREAAAMAPHYEVFYSLEKTVRTLVADTLADEDADWWNTKVPPHVRKEAEERKQRELDTGITPRSDDPIDFTTFGELGQVITHNWDVFEQTFTSRKAVERVTANLNTLRAPIAHSALLPTTRSSAFGLACGTGFGSRRKALGRCRTVRNPEFPRNFRIGRQNPTQPDPRRPNRG